MKNLLPYLSLLILFFLSHIERSKASVIAGELTYKHISGLTYEINATIYHNCFQVTGLSNKARVRFESKNCGRIWTGNQNPKDGNGTNEESPEEKSYYIDLNTKSKSIISSCGGRLTECESHGSVIGIYKVMYTGIYTFPTACDDWHISLVTDELDYKLSNKSENMSNQLNLEATLDNKNFPSNNSPTLMFDPIALFTIGKSQSFQQPNIDSEDILEYSLIAPSQMSAIYSDNSSYLLLYKNPYTYTNPISSSTPFILNSSNGTITVSPTAAESTIFTVLIKEKRGGRVVGTVRRNFYMRAVPEGFYCK